MDLEDEDSFMNEKIESFDFPPDLVKEMQGYEFTLEFVQKYGFHSPFLFRQKSGLGLTVPGEDFNVDHVRMCVGSKRLVKVFDMKKQKYIEMSMKNWCKYFNGPEKDRILEVPSLEFSDTRLEDYVKAPEIVRQIDWVSTVWPKNFLRDNDEGFNDLPDLKIQNYCLMSSKGFFRNFSIAPGGTTSWYHVIQGVQVYWLMPPTEKNLQLYKKWLKMDEQSSTFFGDLAEKCSRVFLFNGNTIFIPSGWIFAVYANTSSLVFGGNFLHSFSMEMQIKVHSFEKTLLGPLNLVHHFFVELLWYVLARYIFSLSGKNHLNFNESEARAPIDGDVHLTFQELVGLKSAVMFIHSLESHEKCAPDLIKDPIALIKDVRDLVLVHRNDDEELACTGRYILREPKDGFRPTRSPILKTESQLVLHTRTKNPIQSSKSDIEMKEHLVKTSWGQRRHRVRCKQCAGCLRKSCGDCSFCLDMTQFGGTGKSKKTCVLRQCNQPLLPLTAICEFCGLAVSGPQSREGPHITSNLFECVICYKVAHPKCYSQNFPGGDGEFQDSFPNSWVCPRCCSLKKKSSNYKFSRTLKLSAGRRDSTSSTTTCDSPDVEIDSDTESQSSIPELLEKKRKIETNPIQKLILRKQLGAQWTTEKLQEIPYCIVKKNENPAMERSVMVPIFRYLSHEDLKACALVCKAWARFSLDPKLWQKIDLSGKRLSAAHLAGVARRQPLQLIINRCVFAYKQLKWLMVRLYQLKDLSMEGIHSIIINHLPSSVCASLRSLNISSAKNFTDVPLRDLLSPTTEPENSNSLQDLRLRNLRLLKMNNCDISDTGLRYIAQYLPRLEVLEISSCSKITDSGILQLIHGMIIKTLTSLVISHLPSITDLSLDYLSKCEALEYIDISHTPNISNDAVERFKKRRESIEILRDER